MVLIPAVVGGGEYRGVSNYPFLRGNFVMVLIPAAVGGGG
jgi:hypothetical protein